MSKKNISATVDPEIADFVQRSDVNASGLINKLLKQHMSGETGQERLLQMRISQIEEEIRTMENSLESKREERDRLKTKLEEIQEEADDILDEAAESLTPQDLELQNMKVKYWKEEAGISYNELEEELEKRWRQ